VQGKKSKSERRLDSNPDEGCKIRPLTACLHNGMRSGSFLVCVLCTEIIIWPQITVVNACISNAIAELHAMQLTFGRSNIYLLFPSVTNWHFHSSPS
jgi:hypothetical protein